MVDILYVFGGEKAQGAEIVIERLIEANTENVTAHLMISPGYFADSLLAANKPYKICLVNSLKKLNRSSTNAVWFYLKAIRNYISLSYIAYKYTRKYDINIVHANTIVPSSYLLPLVLFSKIFKTSQRFFWSDHDLKYYSTLDKILSKWCTFFYDKTLTVSEAVKRKYQDSKKVFVLYNGLNPSVFKEDINLRNSFRINYNFSDSTIILGMAAVVAPRKGQLALIVAFNDLLKTHSNIRLVFAGGFGYDDIRYNSQVKDSINNNEKIMHIGFVDDVVSFYNGCDIIFSNSNISESEPLGTSIYEAMACKKIVVASDTGGTAEIITNGVDGYLFTAENSIALKQILRDVLFKWKSLEGVKESAVEKARSKFNIETMVAKYNILISSYCRA